jgi:hypothetical protein
VQKIILIAEDYADVRIMRKMPVSGCGRAEKIVPPGFFFDGWQ